MTACIASVLWLCALYVVHGFERQASRRGPQSSIRTHPLLSMAKIDISDSVAADIKAYLAVRPADETTSSRQYSVMEQVGLREEIAGPENDIVPELKQTGWFRDPREEDEKKRFDKSMPMVSHPLSFRELEKYGYGHLVKPILDLGGPYVVGEAIGYNWIEPTFEVDESKRPERKESFAMDIDADLSVGGSLDDKLEKAADLDLGKLKKEIEERRRDGDGNKYYVPPPSFVPRNELMDYASIKKPDSSPSPMAESREPSALSRVINKRNIMTISLAAAFAFGRCTEEVADLYHLNDVAVTGASVALIGIAFVSVLSDLKSGEDSRPLVQGGP